MATPGKSVLLDTSVVVRHFREASALAPKFAAFEELYLPQPALAELYAGAFRRCGRSRGGMGIRFPLALFTHFALI